MKSICTPYPAEEFPETTQWIENMKEEERINSVRFMILLLTSSENNNDTNEIIYIMIQMQVS